MTNILDKIDKYLNEEVQLKKVRGNITCYFPSYGDGYYDFNEVPKDEIDFFKKAGLKVSVIRVPGEITYDSGVQAQFTEYVKSLNAKGLKLRSKIGNVFPKYRKEYDWDEIRSVIVVNGDAQKIADALEKLIDADDFMFGFDENGLESKDDIESFIKDFKTTDRFLEKYDEPKWEPTDD